MIAADFGAAPPAIDVTVRQISSDWPGHHANPPPRPFLINKGVDMNETKPWYLSRTIWASLVTIALPLAGTLGMQRLPRIDEQALTDTLLQACAGIAAWSRSLAG